MVHSILLCDIPSFENVIRTSPRLLFLWNCFGGVFVQRPCDTSIILLLSRWACILTKGHLHTHTHTHTSYSLDRCRRNNGSGLAGPELRKLFTVFRPDRELLNSAVYAYRGYQTGVHDLRVQGLENSGVFHLKVNCHFSMSTVWTIWRVFFLK